MNCLEELLTAGKLLCPGTRVPVEVRGGRAVSPDGSRDFGPAAGPVNLLPRAEATIEPARVPEAEVERVRAHLQLPAEPAVRAEIAEAIAATGMRFGRDHLSAEARILAERFQMPAFALGVEPAPQPSALRRLAGTLGQAFAPAKSGPRLERLSDSIGERLTMGLETWRSVRVRNAGDAALVAQGAKAARVEMRWADAQGRDLPECAVATPVPIDIEPGREITLIVRVRAPSLPGRFALRAQVATGADAAAAPFLAMPVEVIRCELPVFEYAYHPAILDYESDHRVAVQELMDYLALSRGGQPATVLEIGGGVHPTGHALACLGHKVLSADISHSQSILGTLFFRHQRPDIDPRLGFVSCEGTELPVADGTFDGVMLFASFHHFAEPVALLRELQRVTRPGGFVYLGCDNCAPDPSDPLYVEELRRGINEQVWTLAEFAGFFREAGLRVARARIDHHSLKVVLEKGHGG